MRRVRLAHRGGTEVTVITFASWSPSAIWDRGNLYVFLDTSGGADAEYFVLVRSTGRTSRRRCGASGPTGVIGSCAT